MSEEKLCKYLLSCGYCEKFDKECTTFKILPTGYLDNSNTTISTSNSDSRKLTFTSNVMEPKKAIVKCKYWKYQAPNERYCSGQKNSPRCYCGGDKDKCETRYFKE